MTTDEVSLFCGYIIRKLWQQPLPDGTQVFSQKGPALDAMLAELARQCERSAYLGGFIPFTGDPAKALQVEFKYFVKNPQFVPDKTCLLNRQTGKTDCDERVVPKFVRAKLGAYQDFFLAKDYGTGFSGGVGAGSEIKKKFGDIVSLGGASTGVEIGGGVDASVGSYNVQGNAMAYASGVDFDVDMLKFKVHADDGERCLSVRLNPTLFFKQDTVFIFWKQDNLYTRAMRSDLTSQQLNSIMSRGIMICDGQPLGRPLDFSEEYFFVRPSSGKGLVGDTLSSQYIKDWFISLRGVGDYLTFRSLLQNSYDRPESSDSDVLASQVDYGPLQANFARGSRSMPGVFSTAKPLPLGK